MFFLYKGVVMQFIMKLILVSLLFLTATGYSSEKNINSRLDIYISEILKLTSYFTPYQQYIGDNGLFNDQTYIYLIDHLSKSKAFKNEVEKNTSYKTTEAFFTEFKHVTKAYSCYTFKKNLGKRSVGSYLSEIDGAEKKLFDMKTKSKNKKEVNNIESKLKAITILKTRIKEYQEVSQKLDAGFISAIQKRENELDEIYLRILVPNH